MKTLKTSLFALMIVSALAIPALVLAHGDEPDGHDEPAATQGVVHVHDDGTVDVHSASEFALATP